MTEGERSTVIIRTILNLNPAESEIGITITFIQKRFYNKETNSAAFCVIHRMYLKPSSLLS